MTSIIVDAVLSDDINRARNRGLFPPYGLALMAGQMPEKVLGVPLQVRVWDMYCNGPYDPLEQQPDIIWLSSLTPGIEKAYEVALASKSCRSHAGKPIKTIIGGIHATALPLETLQFANIVVRGELTPSFQKFLLKRLIEMNWSDKEVWRLGSIPQVIQHPPARWDLVDSGKYWLPGGIVTESGCGMDCPFCSTTSIFGQRLRLVDEDCAARDIAVLPPGNTAVYNDNFLLNAGLDCIRRSMLIAKLLWENGRHHWVPEVTLRTLKSAIDVAKEKLGIDLLGHYYQQGCRGMFFGIETVGSKYLKKSLPDKESARLIRLVNSYGILTVGAFVLGVDPEETRDKPKQILDFAIDQAELGGVLASINTPFPGSMNFLEAVRNGTLLHRGWDHYKGEFASIRHPNLTPEELEQGMAEVCEGMCSSRSMFGRLVRPFFSGRRPITNMSLILKANVAAAMSAKRWLGASTGSNYEPIVEKPLRPEVLASVRAAYRENPSSPRLFDINRPEDGISRLFHDPGP